MKRKQILHYFTAMHNFHLIEGRGDFAVSPDGGDIKRVFLADIKKRSAGTVLLGVIGFQIFPRDFYKNRPLELSAYITNFDDFLSPPILESESSAMGWIDLIAHTLLTFPLSSSSIINSCQNQRIGNLPIEPFLASSPDHVEFFDKLNGKNYI